MENLDKSLNLIVCHAFTLSKLTRTDKENALCHFERSDPTGCKAQAAAKKSIEFKIHLWIYGYFATLSMTKNKSV